MGLFGSFKPARDLWMASATTWTCSSTPGFEEKPFTIGQEQNTEVGWKCAPCLCYAGLQSENEGAIPPPPSKTTRVAHSKRIVSLVLLYVKL